MDNFFNPDNWNHCQYRNQDQFAIISLMAEPGILDDNFSYCVTVLDDENNEIFQSVHENVMEACKEINTRYQDIWNFQDLRTQSDGSGCSTCVAH